MGTLTNGDAATVFRLLYRSHDLIAPGERKVELGRLFSVARSRNKASGVTGALLLDGEHFVQVLEGPEPTVRALFDRIVEDPRHDRVELLDTAPDVSRVFSRWAMAEVGGDGVEDTPLISHRDGISPAAGHPVSPDQAALLAIMRSAAHGSSVHL